MGAGQMPNLSALVERGVCGELSSFAPFLSPMLWTTIATGHHPDRHGVHGFAEVDPSTGEARAVGTQSRQVKALWNMVSQQGGTAGVVGWMGSFPAEAIHGAFVSDAFGHAPANPASEWPVTPGTVYPFELGQALEELRLRPEEVDPGLLGLFVPELRTKGMSPDPHLGQIMQRLSQLYTLQNAAVAIVGQEQPDFFAVYFHFLDLISHEFISYHPPRHSRVSVGDYERYKDVVSAAYRVQDALLGDLLRHCAPDTGLILVSDHGFKTGAARPPQAPRHDAGLIDWHRREGIVVAHGPGIKKGERFCGVRPHDIAPTVLAWLGMPRGEDMPGRVLEEMFLTAPKEMTIPSWQEHPPIVGAPKAAAIAPVADEQARLTQRFIELGYLDPAVMKDSRGGDLVTSENQAHLGATLRDLGRPEEALPLLHAAALADPESATRAVELTYCLLDLGLTDEAERAAQPFFDHGKEQPRALLLNAQILIARGRFAEALQIIERLTGTELAQECGGLRRLILLRSGRHEEARTAFLAEIPKAPGRVTLYMGLAHACLWTGRYAEAMAAARSVLALDRSSVFAELVLEDAERCQAKGRPPDNTGWDALAQAARQRVAWRAEFQERERAFFQAREIRRSLRNAVETRVSKVQREPIVVVSGVPRSGTSMMMRMLALAGVPVFTDGVRVADADNPLGYFEWEQIKRIATEPQLMSRVEGKAIKVVSALLADLPGGWNYELIFMRRDAGAILRSQERMLARTGHDPFLLNVGELERHIEATLEWARANPEIRLLEIDYDAMVERPREEIARLIEFIGHGRIKRPAGLLTGVRGDLRNQLASGKESSNV